MDSMVNPMVNALAAPAPGLSQIMGSYYGAGGGHDVSAYAKALDPMAAVTPGSGSGPPVMASPEDQKMLNADVPMSNERANAIYDAYKRAGGGTDVSASAKAMDPYAAIPPAGNSGWIGSLLTDVSKAMSPLQLQRLLGAPMYTPADAVIPPPPSNY